MRKLFVESGPAIAFWLLALAAQLSGYTSAAASLAVGGVAAFLLVAPAYDRVRSFAREQGFSIRSMTTAHLFFFSALIGTWIFFTVGILSAGWIILSGKSLFAASANANAIEEGPAVWYRNLSMEGGPLSGRNVFSITFRGANTSQAEIELKDASIVSGVNGTKVTLNIVAQNEVVSLNEVQLIPPGSPINLVAKFGPPDPNNPGKILGLDANVFIATWKQFSLNITDDKKSYRVLFNEGDIAPFFPGMVGPHVSKKISLA